VQVVVAWHPLSTTDNTKDAVAELRECVGRYSWVKPMGSHLYIVRVARDDEREQLHEALVAVAREYAGSVHLVVSPAFPDGTWGGWLPRDMWQKVRRRSLGES
jgi:hypothetical protein